MRLPFSDISDGMHEPSFGLGDMLKTVCISFFRVCFTGRNVYPDPNPNRNPNPTPSMEDSTERSVSVVAEVSERQGEDHFSLTKMR